MQLNRVLVLSILSALGGAENTVERDDVPAACIGICQSTIDLSARCDRGTDGDDAYRRCVCLEPGSQLQLNQCAVCVQLNGMRDPDDNDVADLMDDCGWDFNRASASVTAVTPTTTSPTTAPTTSPTTSPTVVVSTSTDQSTTTTITRTSSITASDSSATQSSAGSIPDNAAPTPAAGAAGLLVAAGAAMLLL